MRAEIPMTVLEHGCSNIDALLRKHGIDPDKPFTTFLNPGTNMVEITQKLDLPITFGGDSGFAH